MKKIFRTVAALAVVMFAGCTTDLENEVIAPEVGGTTVTVGIADTKTYLGELVDGARKVYWHNDDQIAINGVASTAIEVSEDKTSANFTFEGAELNYPYSVLYPASMYKDAQTITLPAVQNGATNSFAKDVAPMAASVAAGNVTLHHLAGVIRLQVKLPAESTHATHPLNKVETKGNAGEQMAGDFAIDYAAVTLAGLSTAEADKVVTTKAYKELSAEDSKDVFIVVPAREYPQGITVRLIDDAGHYMDIASKAMTIEAGEIKAMPVVEFAPTGTIVGAEIASAADLVAFAKAYNAGEYAGVDPFVVALTQDIVFDDATNAAWEPIGNIFEDKTTNYFHGVFDGGNHSIKNWVATKSLFEYSGGGSTIKDLTIDASCSFTFSDDVDGSMGAFVGYHKGLLTNCTNNANISLKGEWTNAPRIGGIVGRLNEGHIVNCTMNGNITDDNTFFPASGNIYVGGILGSGTNANGLIETSHMHGNLTLVSGVKLNSSSYYVGGIAGMFRGIKIEGCTNGTEGETTGGVYITTRTEAMKEAYVGGILGMFDKAAGSADVVKSCTNYAKVEFGVNTATHTLISLGGIVGTTKAGIDQCVNYGNIAAYAVTATVVCHNVYVGGLAGYATRNTDSPAALTISNSTNHGESLFTGHKDGGTIAHYWLTIGGILGCNKNGDCTYVEECTNNGLVGVSFNGKAAGRGSASGGIVGLLYAGESKIDGCINNGYVCNHNFNNNTKAAVTNTGTGLAGGIVGDALGASGKLVTITNCQSNCQGGPSTYSARLFLDIKGYPGVGVFGLRGINGGLAGYCSYANVTNCTTKANVYQHQNAYVGGAVGRLDNSTLGGCTVNAQEIKTNSSNVLGAGGLVGYTTNSTLSNNIFNSALTGAACTAYGVLAGEVGNATTITDSKVKGTLYNAAITLSTAMVGKGTATVSGTTLYTE